MLLLNETHSALIEVAREIVWEQLAEGVFDPYILKAIFLCGGGGSGKGFISNVMFGTVKDMATTALGIKSVNSDDITAAMFGGLDTQKRALGKNFRVGGPDTGAVTGTSVMGKAGLGGRRAMSMTTQLGSYQGQKRRDRAKILIGKRKGMFIRGRLGLIIDGTADDYGKLSKRYHELQSVGYDCSMVFVNTTLEVALQRNQMRARVVPEEHVRAAHERIQKEELPKYKVLFGNNFAEVPNNDELTTQQVTAVLGPKLHKIALRFLEKPLKNPIGIAWLAAETEGMPPSMLKKVTWIGKKQGR